MIILEQLGVSSLGILLYNLWKIRKFLKNPKQMQTKAFWVALWIEIKFVLLWTYLMLVVLATTIFFYPELGASIKSMTGFDVNSSIISFFTLGGILSSVVDRKE